MTYQEKKTLVTVLTSILLFTAYFLYVSGRLGAGLASSSNMKFWAVSILSFIGIGIVATIIIQIVFHILLSVATAVKETVQNGKCDDGKVEKIIEQEMVEDERDKLIEMKSSKIGYAVAGVGFVLGLVSLLLGYSPEVMLNIAFCSFGLGSVVEGIVQIYFYRRGFNYGR